MVTFKDNICPGITFRTWSSIPAGWHPVDTQQQAREGCIVNQVLDWNNGTATFRRHGWSTRRRTVVRGPRKTYIARD